MSILQCCGVHLNHNRHICAFIDSCQEFVILVDVFQFAYKHVISNIVATENKASLNCLQHVVRCISLSLHRLFAPNRTFRNTNIYHWTKKGCTVIPQSYDAGCAIISAFKQCKSNHFAAAHLSRIWCENRATITHANWNDKCALKITMQPH